MTLDRIILLALFAMGIGALVYLAISERQRRVGQALIEEFEIRRKLLKLERPAVELAWQHIDDLDWMRRCKESAPDSWAAQNQAPPPVRPPKPKLTLVHCLPARGPHGPRDAA
jgi:hypothetical protein